jgi:hypothetical protein
MDTVIRVAEGT